jgi:hypothetical protein
VTCLKYLFVTFFLVFMNHLVSVFSELFSFYPNKINVVYMNVVHVRWVPCHHGMAHPQVADGGNGLQIWRVAAIILNKQSRTADKGWSSSLGVGRGANNSSS